MRALRSLSELYEGVAAMELVICCVFDSAVGAFGRPHFVRSRGESLRAFQDEVNREPTKEIPNPLFSHSTDYQLYYLGTFDDNTGKFTMPAMPEKMINATDVNVAL